MTTIDVPSRTRREDLDLLERAGIAPELLPRPSRARALVLAGALLLAGATVLLAALFSAGAAHGSAAYETGATQCPMTAPPSGPAGS